MCVVSEKDSTKQNRVASKSGRVAFAPPSISIGTKVKGRIRRLTHKQRDTHVKQNGKIEKKKKSKLKVWSNFEGVLR